MIPIWAVILTKGSSILGHPDFKIVTFESMLIMKRVSCLTSHFLWALDFGFLPLVL